MGSNHRAKKNHFGFALVEGLVALSILIVLAITIGSYVSTNWKRSVDLERSSASVNAANIIVDSFKAKDNRTEPIVWQMEARQISPLLFFAGQQVPAPMHPML